MDTRDIRDQGWPDVPYPELDGPDAAPEPIDDDKTEKVMVQCKNCSTILCVSKMGLVCPVNAKEKAMIRWAMKEGDER
jgi:hypothetical protein